MGLRLLNGWVVIRDLEPDEKMIGSLHIPEGSIKEPHKWAEVIEVGKGKGLARASGFEPMTLKKGDKVFYVRFLKATDTGKALTPILAREYGPGAFLIQEQDVVCYEPAE